jgi:geranylgeranyl diphosphate synthase type II
MIENEALQQLIDRIDTSLVRYFSDKDLTCNPLDRAMEYTLLAGGKRLRALLVLVTCKGCGGDVDAALPFSLAVEMIHTYSLIHDDLPCMDDDDIRRGKPTNHIIFGEANAILAGDALQAEAFQILAETPHEQLPADRRIAMVSELSRAIGRRGMVAGQVMDLTQENQKTDQQTLELLHHRKTGRFLECCVRLGGHLANVTPEVMQALTSYATHMGLLFQVVDDLLDEEATSESLGKTAGKDKASGKATFPKLLGSEAAHDYADDLLEKAEKSLEAVPEDAASDLREIAEFIRHRDH